MKNIFQGSRKIASAHRSPGSWYMSKCTSVNGAVERVRVEIVVDQKLRERVEKLICGR